MKPLWTPLTFTCIALAFGQSSGRPSGSQPKPPVPAEKPNFDTIMRQSLQRELMNSKLLDNYIYETKESTITYDSSGNPTKTVSKVTEHLWLEGSRYKRLLEENGKPLTGSTAAREQRKLDDELKRRREETSNERQKRQAEEAKRREESRKTRDEVAKAFSFRLLGEETMAGAKCWKVAAEPKPGFEGQTRIGRMLPKMRGTFWLHQQTYAWLRAEIETLDAITFGGFLAKLDKGSTFKLEQMRVNEELWAMRRLNTRVTARALFMRFNQAQQIDFRNYRKFSADSRLLEAGPSAH